jgi:tetratricopeptide (TPR) repeat protein
MKTQGRNRLAALGALATLAFPVAAIAAGKVPITTSSEEARRLYLQGRELAEKLRATDAHALYLQAVAKDPKFALAHVGLANTSATAKEFFDEVGQAVALVGAASQGEQLLVCALDAGVKGEVARQRGCLDQLVRAHPDDERVHNQLGGFHFGRQEYAEAVAAYERATAIDPGFSPPYNLLGYSHRFLGDFAAAERAFQRYIQLIPGDPNPYDSYAELLMKMGRFADSIANYEKALALDKNFVASYVGIGNDQIFMGRGEEARRTFGRLATVARNDGEKRQAHFWTAMSYVHEGANDKALLEIGKMAAIAETGKDWAAVSGDLNQLGDILLEAGRADEALARYEEQLVAIAKADVPDEVRQATARQATFDRARVALARNDLAGARAHAAEYAAAVQAKNIPFEVRQHHELAGRLALQEKNAAAAVAELRQANQQDPRVLYLLALALQGAGDSAGARSTAARAADFNALSGTYGFVRAKARALAATAG